MSMWCHIVQRIFFFNTYRSNIKNSGPTMAIRQRIHFNTAIYVAFSGALTGSPELICICRPAQSELYRQDVAGLHGNPARRHYCRGAKFSCISSLHAYSYIQQSGRNLQTMNDKNTKKSPIHESADANITCDFGDISHYRSRFTHTRASLARL